MLIEGTDRIGGVWKFRTTSWNTVNAILSSLALIKTITGGPLAGIPLHLVLSPKTVTVPTTGLNVVVFVVSLEYRGPEQELALGYDIAKRRLEHRVKMEHIEAQARRMLLPPHAEPIEEQAETGAEFYPEVVEPEPVPLTEADPAGEAGLKVTELSSDGEGVLRVEFGPEPTQPSAKGKKHLKSVKTEMKDARFSFNPISTLARPEIGPPRASHGVTFRGGPSTLQGGRDGAASILVFPPGPLREVPLGL